ncbi:uncharacterized protein LOC5519017 [Nematostella vectensis]|uniref:uncharacterized protein LOC5519017 n=1 Tax=Nematostella vectensis TaxID=45351 RepID=UPI001390084E|nr:uncharacterized protein LOC5519017 [Nematostella vectensis]
MWDKIFMPCVLLVLLMIMEAKACSKTDLTDRRKDNHYAPSPSECDNNLAVGTWYNFKDQAGTNIGTRCVESGYCEAESPGWFLGVHPTEKEQTTGRICFRVGDDCCAQSVAVDVRKCGNSFHYSLKAAIDCSPKKRICGSDQPDGGWTDWTIWTPCDKSCGTGFQQRKRTCSNPSPQNGGALCAGTNNETRECNTHHCPINGDWTEWSSWSYCNRPCGTGYENRTRSCTNPPPKYGGKDCEGEDHQAKTCNTDPCPAVVAYYEVRFTEEIYTEELHSNCSQPYVSLSNKIKENMNSVYGSGSTSVMDIEIIYLRNGSVISGFNVSYSSVDSLQLVRPLEAVDMTGALGTMPAQVIAVIPDNVPATPPTLTHYSNSSSTSILLQWAAIPASSIKDGALLGYRAYYKQPGAQFTANQQMAVAASANQMEIKSLKKYTLYTIVLLAFTTLGNGVPTAEVTLRTDEDVPSQPPQDFKVQAESSTMIYAEWKAISSESVHGILLGFNLSIGRHGQGSAHWTHKLLPPSQYSLMFEELSKFTEYTLAACGYTSKGCGVISHVTVRTHEDVPSLPPQQLFAANLTSQSTITLTWSPVPRGHVNGVLRGYILRYSMTSSADIRVRKPKTLEMRIPPEKTRIELSGLQSYSLWKFQLLAYTSVGEGPETEVIVAETCRCPKTLYSNFYVNPPYLSKSDNGKYGGVFFNVSSRMLAWACGNCANGHGVTVIDQQTNGRGEAAKKDYPPQVQLDIDEVPQISFPILGYPLDTDYLGIYKFIYLMESPGIAFITIADPPGSAATRMVLSVFDCMPLFVMAVLMNLLAGIIMWGLDSRANPEEFSPKFTSGVGSGFWWAYISMTSVGYGDRSPVKVSSRLFAIIWTLAGLVLTSLLTGSIATSLTTAAVSTEVILYGAKVGAIHNSTEHRVGILKNARMNEDQQYKDVSELRRALESREVRGILLDVLVAAEFQEDLFRPGIRVNKILDKRFGYGIVLSGQAAIVHERCRDYIQKNIKDITEFIVNSTKTLKEPESIEEEDNANLFDANSSLFQEFLMTSLAMLGSCCLLGFLWYYGYYKRTQVNKGPKGDTPMNTLRQENIKEMRNIVKEFYQRLVAKINDLKISHKKYLKDYIKQTKSWKKGEVNESIDSADTCKTAWSNDDNGDDQEGAERGQISSNLDSKLTICKGSVQSPRSFAWSS